VDYISLPISPRRISIERVDVIVDYVGVGVFLPSAGGGVREKVASAALIVDGIFGEIQSLAGFQSEGIRVGGFGVECQDGSVSGIGTVPGLAIFVLTVGPNCRWVKFLRTKSIRVVESSRQAGSSASLRSSK